MPTISLQRDDLEALIAGSDEKSARIPLDQLEQWLMLVKGELKEHNAETGELRIELQDSNRPDLWCCEGIARQIRIKQRGSAISYPFFKKARRVAGQLIVAQGMEQVRPYVAACTAVGYRVTASGLTQLIQTQEKLADIFGRKRRSVSIGLYRLAPIVFPVSYDLVKPDDVRFTPLGMETMPSSRCRSMISSRICRCAPLRRRSCGPWRKRDSPDSTTPTGMASGGRRACRRRCPLR